MRTARLHHFSDFVLDDRLDDVPSVFLPFREGLGELPGLIGRNLARERWLVGIDRGFDKRRPSMMEGFAQHGPDKRRIFDRETGDATGPRDRDEVDGL